MSWFTRLIGLEHPSYRKLSAVEDRLDGLEARVDARYAELKAMRGKVYGGERKNPSDDAPGEAIETEPAVHPGGARRIRKMRGW